MICKFYRLNIYDRRKLVPVEVLFDDDNELERQFRERCERIAKANDYLYLIEDEIHE